MEGRHHRQHPLRILLTEDNMVNQKVALRLLDRRLGTLVRTVRALLTLTRLDGAPAQTEAEEELLSRLVALNGARAAEEAAEHVRGWLGPSGRN